MGTWGTAIKSNDTSSDIYADFFELYNEGQEPAEISKKMIKENTELINNPDDCNNFWFVLALAQWETKSLEQELYEKVKSIIESEQDLEVWRELDADESEIKKRKIVLEKFLDKISPDKPKAKARKKKRIKEPVFDKGACLTFKLENGNFGGAVVLAADNRTSYGYNLIVSTRLNQTNRPTKKEFEKSKVLVASFGNWKNEPKVTWYLPDRFKKEYSDLFDIVGKIEVDKDYTPNGTEIKASFSAGWQHIIESVNSQFEYENDKGETKSFPLTELTKRKKWWKF
ncbi:hypothetical protein [Cyclobacterium marinum]|uniref:DUF4259 domain-containing protein n=1 Tax=Cyclobacterium marinum (strain ATCC 25205 / DSM 745 / LMG 13164 / NCIMB 1802) TaxID=880070 RepID=G0J4T2_CYCMS|nr:hypothetical protein [Cyclobacterium marinum]AEL25312.1 hypothetical protein Cycma_1552 [Cyclobacterium marinum DSM 745]